VLVWQTGYTQILIATLQLFLGISATTLAKNWCLLSNFSRFSDSSIKESMLKVGEQLLKEPAVYARWGAYTLLRKFVLSVLRIVKLFSKQSRTRHVPTKVLTIFQTK
jgi:hypothetical protein